MIITPRAAGRIGSSPSPRSSRYGVPTRPVAEMSATAKPDRRPDAARRRVARARDRWAARSRSWGFGGGAVPGASRGPPHRAGRGRGVFRSPSPRTRASPGPRPAGRGRLGVQGSFLRGATGGAPRRV